MAEQVSESPLVVLDRIKVNQKLGENMNVPGVLSDIGLFVQMGVTKLPETSKYLKNFGLQKNVRTTLLYRIREGYQRKDTKGVLQDLSIAEAIGMSEMPEVAPYLTYIQTNLKNESEKPAPKKAAIKKPKQRHLKRRLALAAATGLVAFTSLSGSVAPTPKVGLGSSGEQAASQSDTLSEIEAASEGKEVTASPDFKQLIKPFVEEAMKRRSERAANDPEYYNRVDKELNQDRVNILLYGYGEEWTGGAMDQPTFGSHSIFSINLKTGKIDLVSPTHDTRAPEIEQFLKKNGKEARPTRMDRAYEIGGYDLMRQVLEDATGLSVDYQIRAEDTLIKYLVDNLGGINVDIPFDVNTKQFRDDGKMYPPHQFSKGTQKMDGITALQFIKAWSDPVDPTKERNIRKHLAMKAIFDQVKQKTKEGDRMFGINMFSLLATENLKGNIGFDFDEKQFIFPMLGNLGKLGKLDLSIDKTIFVVDPAIGDGGVQWITANAAENPITQKDVENGVYGQDLAMEIPFNANPYSSNLVRDYWKSVRDLIQSRLGKPQQPAIGEQESPPPAATAIATLKPEPSSTPTEKPQPTATSTAIPPPTTTPTEIPKPPPTPEVKTFKKDILRNQIAPLIYAKIERIRAERETNDPEYYNRIDKELNEGKINILVTGGREDDDLTDSIQLFSWDFATNSLYVISIPRDLQSPEVLQKTKSQVDSKINQATHFNRNNLKQPDPALLKLAVENATGISVDLYMHLGFSFFKDAINKTVKTIDVVLDKDIEDNLYPTEDNWYKRIFYRKGKNTLNGEQALEVARVRHIDSDYERSKRQQMIIEALIKKILSDNFFNQFRHLSTLRDDWYENVLGKSTIKPDFDLDGLFFNDLGRLAQNIPQMFWDKLSGQAKMAEMPTIFTTGLTNRNYVIGAGIKNAKGEESFNTKISGGNPNTSNPRKDYWKKSRDFTKKFITENAGEPPEEEEIQIEIPANSENPTS